ncbi:dynein light chain 1, axonemal [Phthorimaea operculella]|nr:dynein light chain 1, axonemal [Phthorimaea operculella]
MCKFWAKTKDAKTVIITVISLVLKKDCEKDPPILKNSMASLRPTTCKEAIVAWEREKGLVASEAEEIELQFRWPPIEKMDAALSSLVACKKLSLSSNMIEKINGIAGMRNLKILALGRNRIKSLSGIESVADTLEELWISYNKLEKLKGIEAMKKLRVFYMSYNLIKEWTEIKRLRDCPNLRDLLMIGNPICDSEDNMDVWRQRAIDTLPQIIQLDGIPIVKDFGPDDPDKPDCIPDVLPTSSKVTMTNIQHKK